MRPAVAFILGPGKMRTIAPVKLCVWYRGPLRYSSDGCRVSSATVQGPLLSKLIRCLRAFSTTEVGVRKESFIDPADLCSKSVIISPLPSKGCGQFQSQLVKTLVFRYFFFNQRIFSLPPGQISPQLNKN